MANESDERFQLPAYVSVLLWDYPERFLDPTVPANVHIYAKRVFAFGGPEAWRWWFRFFGVASARRFLRDHPQIIPASRRRLLARLLDYPFVSTKVDRFVAPDFHQRNLIVAPLAAAKPRPLTGRQGEVARHLADVVLRGGWPEFKAVHRDLEEVPFADALRAFRSMFPGVDPMLPPTALAYGERARKEAGDAWPQVEQGIVAAMKAYFL